MREPRIQDVSRQGYKNGVKVYASILEAATLCDICSQWKVLFVRLIEDRELQDLEVLET